MSKVIDEKHKDYLDLLVPVICENDRLVEGIFKISSGAAESILVDPDTGIMHGVNDIRKPAGKAIAY